MANGSDVSVGWLIVGRFLQGIATGVASSTFGAAVVELASERRKKVGALMTSLASTAGLGLGALLAGFVALVAPRAAAATVWLVLIVVMALGTMLALGTPETSARRDGAIASLSPTFVIPPHVRRMFVATAPSIVATFALAGLFLGLVPTRGSPERRHARSKPQGDRRGRLTRLSPPCGAHGRSRWTTSGAGAGG